MQNAPPGPRSSKGAAGIGLLPSVASPKARKSKSGRRIPGALLLWTLQSYSSQPGVHITGTKHLFQNAQCQAPTRSTAKKDPEKMV